MNQLAVTQGYQVQAQTITEDLYSRFIAYVDASSKSIDTYTINIRQFFKYLASHGITQPQREDILAYREWLKVTPIEEGNHKGRLRTPATVQGYITAVKLFFQWTEQERIYPNVANHIKGAKIDKGHKKDYLTSRQAKKVLATAKGEELTELRDYAMLALMLTCGLRTIEVSRAKIEDMRARGDSTALYIQGKGHEEKVDFVKLMPEVEDAIRAYLTARGVTDPTEPLFTSTSNNSKGKALSTRTISGIVKGAFKEAGFNSEKLTAHSTRHTAVTLALANGEKLEQVQQFARHKNLETTLIYAHNLDRDKNHCEATIAKALF